MVIYYHPHITYFINGGYMFNTLKTLVLAASLLLPAGAVAAETGVYVAPKFALNVQHTEGNLSFEGQDLGSDSKTGARAGGALAVGYDFAPRFQVPVRAELEYGAYGDVSKTVDMGGGTAFKGTMGFQTLLANVYWDITEWNGFSPLCRLRRRCRLSENGRTAHNSPRFLGILARYGCRLRRSGRTRLLPCLHRIRLRRLRLSLSHGGRRWTHGKPRLLCA